MKTIQRSHLPQTRTIRGFNCTKCICEEIEKYNILSGVYIVDIIIFFLPPPPFPENPAAAIFWGGR